jgi:hypothetical protein
MLRYAQESLAVGEQPDDLQEVYLYTDHAFLEGDVARVSAWDDAQSELTGVGQR